MRIDLFLKASRIVKKRSHAKKLCDEGVVKVNGISIKASKSIKEGDIVEIDTATQYIKFTISSIPAKKNISRKEARKLIKIMEERKKDIKDLIFKD